MPAQPKRSNRSRLLAIASCVAATFPIKSHLFRLTRIRLCDYCAVNRFYCSTVAFGVFLLYSLLLAVDAAEPGFLTINKFHTLSPL